MKNYYVGINMGPESVGWAVTDENYNVIRKSGKRLYGTRLFTQAKTAEERRMARSARRNLDRRQKRIRLLQEMFADEINKVDPGFFLRLKESRYYPEDKRDVNGNMPETPYSLFADADYTDKDYRKQFPTIYHLRKMLMETEETPDIRLVYLAISHMMKNRGHFLISGDIQNMESVLNFHTTFDAFLKAIKICDLDFHIEMTDNESKLVEDTLKNNKLTAASKKSFLCKSLGASTKCEKAVFALISGCVTKLSDLYGDEDLNSNERPKISFSDSRYDDYASVVEKELADRYNIVSSAKGVYDWMILSDILDGDVSISLAKVKSYEKHKEDLAYLKAIVKKYLSKEDYNKIFVASEEKLNNYTAYVGKAVKNGHSVSLQNHCSREEFFDFLKKNVISKIDDQETVAYLSEQIETDVFLPRQVTTSNSTIPNQVHLYELKKILDNLSSKIPMIRENADKILKMFTFRVPYFVGPLGNINDAKYGKFTWSEHNDVRILPWNFEENVDYEKCLEEFICRMTNKCFYIPTQDVLPENSLLYGKFVVLNELNNMCLDGQRISVELKQRIFKDVFCKKRNVTRQTILTYLVREGIADKESKITGVVPVFKASMNAYFDFERLSGLGLNDAQKEDIIFYVTLFGNDKSLLKKKVAKEFPQFDDMALKMILGMSYSGWGTMSKMFLTGIYSVDERTGEKQSVMDVLWDTNDNIEQILSSKYHFAEAVKECDEFSNKESVNRNDIKGLNVSPSMKKQIWQTLLVMNEIRNIMGCEPKRIFIGMPQESPAEDIGRKRKKHLTTLYSALKNKESELLKLLDSVEESQFKDDKLFLYFLQKGKCLYSGQKIPFRELWNTSKYNIEHIYPQSKTMDDSIKNKLLVSVEYNKAKSDDYPISPAIQEQMMDLWSELCNEGFLPDDKFERLIRKEELTAEELASFISYQMTEGGYGATVASQVLETAFPDSELVQVRSRAVFQFRSDFGFSRIRELNDYSYAKDAYLDIVVGNTYFVKFTKNVSSFIRDNPGRSYNLRKMFKSNIVKRGNEVAWVPGDDGTICTVAKYMNNNYLLVSRKSYETSGQLSKLLPLKKGNGQIPLKLSDDRLLDISKYGGYDKATGAYFVLVKSKDKKGNEMRTIEFVPIYKKAQVEKSEANMIRYLTEDRGLLEPEVLISKIRTDSLLKIDGFYAWIGSRSNNRIGIKNANQLILDEKNSAVLRKILRVVRLMGDYKDISVKEDEPGLDGKKCILTNASAIDLYDCFTEKLLNGVYSKMLFKQGVVLKDGRETFVTLSLKDKCKMLSEILHLFQCNSKSADLSMIGGAPHAGILIIGNNVSKMKQISIVYQSATGYYEKEVDLKVC